jgi:hypothetical protein
LSDAEWKLMTEMSVEQLKGRILMRNAQFGRPLDAARLTEILAGKCKPLPFDYARAKLAA